MRQIHRLWLLGIALLCPLIVGPPSRAQVSSLGVYPVPDPIGMRGSLAAPRRIRELLVTPHVMLPLRVYTITARVRIEPLAEHRFFVLAFDSPVGGAGLTRVELNTVPGELSPVTQLPILWRDKPGGYYYFALGVYGAGGKLLERKTAEIHSTEGE